MTYREIVLKLLKSRKDIICLEEHLMNDFRSKEKETMEFENWCNSNGIEFAKLNCHEPPRIQLKKKEYNN